jgi:hypothetical protein
MGVKACTYGCFTLISGCLIVDFTFSSERLRPQELTGVDAVCFGLYTPQQSRRPPSTSLPVYLQLPA